MLTKSLFTALLATVFIAEQANAAAARAKTKPAKAESKDQASEFTAEDDAKFTDFAAKKGKSYKSLEEFKKREKKWKEADDYISLKNTQNKDKKNGMKLAHNQYSDLEDDEYLALLGLKVDDEELSKNKKSLTKGAKKDEEKGRKLQSTSVDHSKLGHMTPVKNQGSCGSCWAFTSTTVLEGTIAALNDTTPVRLSEQQLVDCNKADPTLATQKPYNRNYGCNGGWMTYAWYYHFYEGAMLDADYAYTGVEGECQYDATKATQKVAMWGQITESVEAIQEKLLERPLSFAMNASTMDFRLYSEGIFDGLQNDGTPVPTTLNHAMTIVGYSNDGFAEETTSTEYVR